MYKQRYHDTKRVMQRNFASEWDSMCDYALHDAGPTIKTIMQYS